MPFEMDCPNGSRCEGPALSFCLNFDPIILINSIRRGMHSLRREINLYNGNADTGCTVLEIRWATASNHVKSSRNLVLFSGNKHIRHSAFLAFPPAESSKSACLLQRRQNHLARAEKGMPCCDSLMNDERRRRRTTNAWKRGEICAL